MRDTCKSEVIWANPCTMNEIGVPNLNAGLKTLIYIKLFVTASLLPEWLNDNFLERPLCISPASMPGWVLDDYATQVNDVLINVLQNGPLENRTCLSSGSKHNFQRLLAKKLGLQIVPLSFPE